MESKETNLQLRIKTRNGQFVIDSLNGKNCVGELKSVIWSLTNLHPDTYRVLIGFPPQELFLVDDEQHIFEVLPNKRETLILEESAGTGGSFRANRLTTTIEPINVGFKRKMKRIEVPSNNSCLFVSVYYCITGQIQNKCPELRELIAEVVKNDPVMYNEGFLGKPNSEYCTWIRNEDHWGGGIELSILSKYYEVEIAAVDTQNTRLNRFGEDKSYSNRIFLIFDGIHYDPLVMESSDVNNPVQTMFPASDTKVIDIALEFARIAKQNHQYTDLNRMSLRCNKCNKSFSQNEARSHASATGHTDFSEINS